MTPEMEIKLNELMEKFALNLFKRTGVIRGARIFSEIGKMLPVLNEAPEDIKDDLFNATVEILQLIKNNA